MNKAVLVASLILALAIGLSLVRSGILTANRSGSLTTNTGEHMLLNASDTMIFGDDFEGYAVGSFPAEGGWELWFNGAGAEYQTIVDSISYSPSKSLQLWGYDFWAGFAAKRFSTALSQIGFEAYVNVAALMASSRDSARISFTKWTSPCTSTEIGCVAFLGDGRIISGGQPLGTYNAGTWYKVSYLLDRPTATYNVWIDDTLCGENLSLTTSAPPSTGNPAYEIDAFSVSQCYNNVKIYFDNVQIFGSDEHGTPPGPPPTPPQYSIVTISTSGNGYTVPSAAVYTNRWLVGDNFTVQAIAYSGNHFINWARNGNNLTGTSNSLIIESAGTTEEIVAYFAQDSTPPPPPIPPPTGPAYTILYIEPANISNIAIGSTFNITVNVFNVTDLFVWQTLIQYDASILNCRAAIYPSENYIFNGKSQIPVSPIIDNIGGSVAFGAALIHESASGDGVLCKITFEVMTLGESYMNFSLPYGTDTFLLDSNLDDIPVTLLNASFSNDRLGDVTGANRRPDGEVDMRDVGLIALNFRNSIPPADSILDLRIDGIIDMRDVGIVCYNFSP